LVSIRLRGVGPLKNTVVKQQLAPKQMKKNKKKKGEKPCGVT